MVALKCKICIDCIIIKCVYKNIQPTVKTTRYKPMLNRNSHALNHFQLYNIYIKKLSLGETFY